MYELPRIAAQVAIAVILILPVAFLEIVFGSLERLIMWVSRSLKLKIEKHVVGYDRRHQSQHDID